MRTGGGDEHFSSLAFDMNHYCVVLQVVLLGDRDPHRGKRARCRSDVGAVGRGTASAVVARRRNIIVIIVITPVTGSISCFVGLLVCVPLFAYVIPWWLMIVVATVVVVIGGRRLTEAFVNFGLIGLAVADDLLISNMAVGVAVLVGSDAAVAALREGSVWVNGALSLVLERITIRGT